MKNTSTAEHTALKDRVDALHEAARVPLAVEEGMNSWYDWLVSHVPAPMRRRTSKAFRTFKSSVSALYNRFLKRGPKTTKVKSALKRFTEDHVVELPEPIDPWSFLSDVKGAVKNIWAKKSLKAKLILDCVMVRATDGGEDDMENAHFHSLTATVLPGSDLHEVYKVVTGKILESFANYLRNGSSWRLKEIKRLNVHLTKFKPMKGSSWIPLPEHLAKKKALVNVKNSEGNECFK